MSDADNDTELTAEDEDTIARLESALEDGESLKAWWLEAEAREDWSERFELMPGYPGIEPMWGFFADAEVSGEKVPVMGVVQDLFFDQPKTAKAGRKKAAGWMTEQVREFALKYYLRNLSWSPPQTYPEIGHPPVPKYLETFSWYPPQETSLTGEHAQQVYYRKHDGTAGKFAAGDRDAIIDLRELGDGYQWVALDMDLFDFSLTLTAGGELPKLTVPIKQDLQLVLSAELMSDQEKPEKGVLGSFGPGFAFSKVPGNGLVAYGPDKIEPGVQLEYFRILDNGEVWGRLVFIANRPEKLLNVSVDPLDWGFTLADLATAGAAEDLLKPVRELLDRLPMRGTGFDPVLASMRLINLLTGGLTGDDLGLSKEHLEKEILLKHAQVLMKSFIGTRQTWNQIPDWLDAAAIPPWAAGGILP